MTILYYTENCPRCKRLAAWLKCHEVEFYEQLLDITAICDLRCEGIDPREAPILKVGLYLYEPRELFKGLELDEEKLAKIFMRPT